ncbi:hypothetical protein B0H11DRAFT_2084613 [Mycena galericulata]|nr:hypothetical protein B0H11DRAFT_2084613 [Mycena galericulata]
MAYFNTEAEPFMEAQGNQAAKASPDELKAFYRDMERSDLARKLSKRKSSSLWSRKSVKRTSTSQSHQSAPAPSLQSPSTTSLARGSSIIPETLRELPSWYRENQRHSVRYNMHNPVGPRWYKNHHLIPPSNSRPGTRPPSVFSSSFPAMASGVQDEPGRIPNLTQSQTGMEDGANLPRSRKTSQTAHDNVDLLDGSDPWGTPWHHESPYDVSFEENPHQNPHPAPPRSRTSSVTTAAQNRRKTVTPSPLSQSTSAVHLQVPEANGNQPTRKLSKRRTVGIFGRHTASAPTSPMEAGGVPVHLDVPPRQGPPSSFVPVATSQKDRRSSMFGRLAKRFSITRKPPVVAMEVVRQPSPVKRQPSPEKAHTSDPIKRVPPPLVHSESSFVVIPQPAETSKIEADRSSSISFEGDVAYTMGRLTVANPDPGSVESTPVQRELCLPPEEDREPSAGHGRGASYETLSTSPPPDTRMSIQRTQSPEKPPTVSRSPENIASPSIPGPSRQPASENVGHPQSTSQRTASPPPPPAPEKPAANFTNDHRSARSSSAPPNSVELSASPPSNKIQVPSAPTSHVRVQSPPVGNQSPEKPQPPPPSPPSPKLPAVPFPADYGPTPVPPPRDLRPPLPEMTADISPLSASSILVNPPTPYTTDTLMPDEPEPMPPPVPSKRSSRDPSPSQVAVTGRETETFRLVRSASGTVYASSETIRAGTEQWEVVESKSRAKNRSQDRESESRREQRRQARAEKEAESEQPKVRSEHSRKRRSAEAGASNSQTFPRSDSADRHHRASIPETLVSRQEDARASRPSRDEERERKSERKSTDPRLNKPQPAPPAAPSRHVESKTTRPISEVPNTEDLNMMKAREAWDMDRLWKARSMSGMEPNGIAAATMPPTAPVSNGTKGDDLPVLYGSSHTAFMVSTPFQQPSASQIYHSMPPAPPPVIYPAAYSPNGYSNTNRGSTSDHASSNAISPRAPLANPLPEPPRESPYEPAPLTLPEYWNKHASVTTAH